MRGTIDQEIYSQHDRGSNLVSEQSLEKHSLDMPHSKLVEALVEHRSALRRHGLHQWGGCIIFRTGFPNDLENPCRQPSKGLLEQASQTSVALQEFLIEIMVQQSVSQQQDRPVRWWPLPAKRAGCFRAQCRFF
jgi:hypothetical protein